MRYTSQKRYFQRSRTMSSIALGTLLTLSVPLQASPQQTTIRLADMFPQNHYLTQQLLIPFMKKVEDSTGGSVKFVHYPAGQLVKAQDMLQASSNGLAGITSVVPLYSSDRLPLSGVIGLPGFDADARSCTEGITEVTNEVLAESEYAEAGVHPLLVVCTAPYEILSKRGPVEGVSDLAGLKIRSPGGLQELVVDRIGAIPVSMASTDIYTALERGTIDGVSASLDTMAAYSLGDHAKSISTNGQFGFVSIAYVINDDLWSELDVQTKQVLKTSAREAVGEYLQWAETSEEELIAAWRSKGINLYEIPQSVLSDWSPRFEQLREEWVDRLDSKRADKVLKMWERNFENHD